MKTLKEKIKDWLGEQEPWKFKYRLVELKAYAIISKEIRTYYQIQAALKIFPFIWFTFEDAHYQCFSTAYTEMKTLRGIPKTKKRVIEEGECVLMLMEEEE